MRNQQHEHNYEIVLVKVAPAYLFSPRRTDFYVACKCSPTTLDIHSLTGELSAEEVTEVTKLWPYSGPVVQPPARATRNSFASVASELSQSGSAEPDSEATNTTPSSDPA